MTKNPLQFVIQPIDHMQCIMLEHNTLHSIRVVDFLYGRYNTIQLIHSINHGIRAMQIQYGIRDAMDDLPITHKITHILDITHSQMHQECIEIQKMPVLILNMETKKDMHFSVNYPPQTPPTPQPSPTSLRTVQLSRLCD